MSAIVPPDLGLCFLLIASAPDAGKAPAEVPAEVVAAIMSNHVDRATLNPARIEEILRTDGRERPAAGVSFAKAAMAGDAAPKPAWRVEQVGDGFVVVRVRSLSDRGVADGIRGEMKKSGCGEAGLRGVVLDLRTLGDFLHFQEGARLMALFVPEATRVFSLGGPGGPAETFATKEVPVAPLVPMAVVIGPGTGGVGEAVAEALRALNRAVVFGAATLGRAAEYSETRLSSGRYLRVPVRSVLSPGGKAVFPAPVKPDLGGGEAAAKGDADMLRDEWRDGVAKFVAEAEAPPRQNEAALVRGENPELEQAIRARIESGDTNHAERAAEPKGGKPKAEAAVVKPALKEPEKEPGVKDAALQQALDFLRGVEATGLNRMPGVRPEPQRPDGGTNAPAKAEGKGS